MPGSREVTRIETTLRYMHVKKKERRLFGRAFPKALKPLFHAAAMAPFYACSHCGILIDGRYLASDTVAVQGQPEKMPSRRVLKTCACHELPVRTLPLTQPWVHAICGWFCYNGTSSTAWPCTSRLPFFAHWHDPSTSRANRLEFARMRLFHHGPCASVAFRTWQAKFQRFLVYVWHHFPLAFFFCCFAGFAPWWSFSSSSNSAVLQQSLPRAVGCLRKLADFMSIMPQRLFLNLNFLFSPTKNSLLLLGVANCSSSAASKNTSLGNVEGNEASFNISLYRLLFVVSVPGFIFVLKIRIFCMC